jgi:hypothetical protein
MSLAIIFIVSFILSHIVLRALHVLIRLGVALAIMVVIMGMTHGGLGH